MQDDELNNAIIPVAKHDIEKESEFNQSSAMD